MLMRMSLPVRPDVTRRALSRLWPRARSESGFTLIEAVMAMAIFATVATAVAGVLTSSINIRSLATQKTSAEQIGNTQLEWIRSLAYADVGIAGGNPSGIVNANGDQSAQSGPTVPSGFTVQVKISWVDDRVPTAIDTKTSYKNAVVTVSRSSTSKVLATQSTQIGPRQRAALGGIDKGVVNARVQVFYTNAPLPNAPVRLENGPSSPLSDTTDASGDIRFPGLTATGTAQFYDLVAPDNNGYIQLPDASVTHFELAAGANTPTKVLQVYKPVTLTANFKNNDGTPFVGNVVFTLANSRGSQSYTYTGTPLTLTTITNSSTGATEPLVPASYTITVTNQAAANFYTSVVTQTVPTNLSDYPNSLTATANVVADALGTIKATVTSAGYAVSGHDVTVSGGPRSLAPQTIATNASGIASFANLPAGSGYTVSAGSSVASQSATVAGGATTNVNFALPTGALKAVVTWAGLKVSGATVTLTGGPATVNLSGTSDANGEVIFSNLAGGPGYTLTATKSSQSVSAGTTVVGGSTTTVALNLPTVSLLSTVTWVGAAVNGALVTLSGGPMSISPVSGTTTSGGTVTFSNVPRGSGYTLSATKNGQTKTLTSQTVNTSPTTNISLVMPQGTISINTATWAGRSADGATVTITGGPDSPTTYTDTTDSSGAATLAVPATTSSYPYTVTVTKNGGSGSATVTSLASGGTATVAPALTPTKTITATVQRNGSILANTSVVIRITGGPNGSPVTYGGTYTTNASGVVSAITVPSGSGGYTVSVWLSNCSLYSTYRSDTNTGVSSTGTGNTSTTLNMNVSGAACPLP